MPGLLVVEALGATLVWAVGTRPERQRFVRDSLLLTRETRHAPTHDVQVSPARGFHPTVRCTASRKRAAEKGGSRPAVRHLARGSPAVHFRRQEARPGYRGRHCCGTTRGARRNGQVPWPRTDPYPHPGRNGGAKARPRRNHHDGIGDQNVRDTAERAESEALSLISLTVNSPSGGYSTLACRENVDLQLEYLCRTGPRPHNTGFLWV